MELEAAFMAGTLTTYQFAMSAYDMYANLTAERTADIFRGSPWLAGIDDVTADIRARGERSLVVTMSPDFFARLVLEQGIDEVRASRFPPFGHLRHTVAVNATPALRRVAARSVDCTDLPTAYRAGRAPARRAGVITPASARRAGPARSLVTALPYDTFHV